MIDLRPVAYVIGLMILILGATMLLPLAADIVQGRGQAYVFVESAAITCVCGMCLALASANGVQDRLTLQQVFLLTTGVWLVLPLFAALPFMLGATDASLVDALFEAMSGLTTTGSTVLVGLDEMPAGLLLWRGLLQWYGGIGVIVMAMVFLPELRVGGMQMFRSEGFDTMGKVLPRAAAISAQVSTIYIGLTVACALAYSWAGMVPFDAVVHAMTTIATGGFSNYDASFGAFKGAHEYIAAIFMLTAALPFVLYVRLLNSEARPLFRDAQVRAFLATYVVIVGIVASVLIFGQNRAVEPAVREALFNTASILTGTGYASANYMLWGGFLISVFFFIGLIGGCAGSTTCSIKVFRYQILFAAAKAQIKRIHSPHGVFTPRYDGRSVTEDVMNSVMAFFVLFIVSLGVFSVALAMTGLDFVTAVSGAATALANVGPGLGDRIGPAGNFAGLPDPSKVLLIAAMLIGRLELMAVYVLFTRRFWLA